MTHPPYQQHPYPPQNGMGVAGFVLGIVGLVFSLLPFGLIGLPLDITGVVLSGVA